MSVRDKKDNPLLKIVERKEAEAAAETPAPSPRPARRSENKPAKGDSRAHRVGTVLVGAHLPPAFQKQLALLSVEEDATKQELLAEAINDLLVKKGKKRIK